MLRPPAPEGCQLPQEEVRTHQPAPTEEEAQIDGSLIGEAYGEVGAESSTVVEDRHGMSWQESFALHTALCSLGGYYMLHPVNLKSFLDPTC